MKQGKPLFFLWKCYLWNQWQIHGLNGLLGWTWTWSFLRARPDQWVPQWPLQSRQVFHTTEPFRTRLFIFHSNEHLLWLLSKRMSCPRDSPNSEISYKRGRRAHRRGVLRHADTTWLFLFSFLFSLLSFSCRGAGASLFFSKILLYSVNPSETWGGIIK